MQYRAIEITVCHCFSVEPKELCNPHALPCIYSLTSAFDFLWVKYFKAQEHSVVRNEVCGRIK